MDPTFSGALGVPRLVGSDVCWFGGSGVSAQLFFSSAPTIFLHLNFFGTKKISATTLFSASKSQASQLLWHQRFFSKFIFAFKTFLPPKHLQQQICFATNIFFSTKYFCHQKFISAHLLFATKPVIAPTIFGPKFCPGGPCFHSSPLSALKNLTKPRISKKNVLQTEARCDRQTDSCEREEKKK